MNLQNGSFLAQNSFMEKDLKKVGDSYEKVLTSLIFWSKNRVNQLCFDLINFVYKAIWYKATQVTRQTG